jgi:hypothetical protein
MRLFYRFLNIARILVWWITRLVIVGVRAILAREGQNLLVRHTSEDLWFMPGGGVKRGIFRRTSLGEQIHVALSLKRRIMESRYSNERSYLWLALHTIMFSSVLVMLSP